METLFTILMFILTTSHALQTETDDKDVLRVMEKFYNKIPETESKYIVNEGLSQIISRHFGGKISAFPLFKINIKLDRKPVKIPWTLDQAEVRKVKPMKKRYKYLKHKELTKKNRE